ncbi:MAG: NAD-dependent epimerase/dehydratase family protein [Sphaerochaetaceae bacterium]
MENTFLVTGSDGHLGNTIVRMLLDKGKKVRGLRYSKSKLLTPVVEECFYGDVTDLNSMDKFFDAPNPIVIHTAGIISIDSKMTPVLNNTNINGTKNVIKQCLKHKARLIYVSSVHAIQESDSTIFEPGEIDEKKVLGAYAKTKAIATKMVRAVKKKIPINVVYPSGILGPYDYGQNAINLAIKEFSQGKINLYLKGGYSLIDVRDVAKAIVNLALSETKQGKEYLLTGAYASIKELLDMTADICGKKKVRYAIPIGLAKIVAPLSSIYYKLQNKPVLFSKYSLYTVSHRAIFSNEAAKIELNFYPRNLKETVKDTLKFFKRKK